MFKPLFLTVAIVAAAVHGYIGFMSFNPDKEVPKLLTKSFVVGLWSVNNERAACIGTLIAPTVVVTSAQCLNSDIKHAAVGAYYSNDTQGIEPISVVKAVKHPQYNPKTHENDVGVVVLAKPSTAIPAEIQWTDATINDRVILRGWGQLQDGTKYSNPLVQVGITPWTDEECRGAYSSLGLNDVIPYTGICAGGALTQACIGDSGAPLTIETSEKSTLIGLFSWGVECDAKGIPGVFTKMSSVRSFLTKWLHFF